MAAACHLNIGVRVKWISSAPRRSRAGDGQVQSNGSCFSSCVKTSCRIEKGAFRINLKDLNSLLLKSITIEHIEQLWTKCRPTECSLPWRNSSVLPKPQNC